VRLFAGVLGQAQVRARPKTRVRCREHAAAEAVTPAQENEDGDSEGNIESEDRRAQDGVPLVASESDGQHSHGLLSEIMPLLKFAVPTLCIAITSPLLSLVDTSVVGLYSEQQLAAMAPATAVADGIYYVMTFIPMAVTNLVALHMARKNTAAAGAPLQLCGHMLQLARQAEALATVVCSGHTDAASWWPHSCSV
jgi:MatE